MEEILNISIENNKVIVNLEPDEFKAFQTMFANLQLMKTVKAEYRDFNGKSWTSFKDLLPMHLCRTIGEANLSDDPFATVSLYPFWKHGFAFGNGSDLALNPQVEDPHKLAIFSDELACGLTIWCAEELFHCVEWADTSALLKVGAVLPVTGKRPDYVCNLSDGSLGIFEAKGTTGGSINQALAEGKIQTAGITAPVPIKHRVVVGAILGEPAKIILLDPEPDPERARHAVPLQTNLTAEMVAKAAVAMRRSRVIPAKAGIQAEGGETIFRSSLGEIKLTTEMKPEKKHTWLDIK
jgi:hypothetical protein